jgi:4-hydroxybenzoate polyprenyltransferase
MKMIPQYQTLLSYVQIASLITKSNMRVMVYPETLFGLCGALSGPLLTTNMDPKSRDIIFRTPKVMLWNWLNLWIFDLANQRLPGSVLEDTMNKPWRAIPSKRINPDQMRRLLAVSIPVVFWSTFYLGATEESIYLMVLTWIYNDLGGGNENFFIRNLNNAIGYITYSSGSLKVACGHPHHQLNSFAYKWLGVQAAIIFSTIQFQDLGDEEGDRARGRSTMPLDIGDGLTRYISAVMVVLWSVVCSMLFGFGVWGYVIQLSAGVTLSLRVLTMKGADADKRTFRLWCLWLMNLYTLPLIKSMI